MATKPPLWNDRKFDFNFGPEYYPLMVERLRGTPARLEEKLSGLSPDLLTKTDGDSWSIQQHVGHLGLVELLWHVRVIDHETGAKTLTVPDPKKAAGQVEIMKAMTLDQMVAAFRERRTALVEKLDGMDDTQVAASAFHERLGVPMRLMDSVFFAAEHDDHHLATMTYLIGKLG